MKSNHKNSCSSPQCNGKPQAACFDCEALYCFRCSLSHSKETSTSDHSIMEFDESLQEMSGHCKRLLKQSQILIEKSKLQAEQTSHESNIKLSPEKFQEQLDEVNFMKKETLKVVEKFFSEISLELVNIWEFYLKKFSDLEDITGSITKVKKKVEVFSQPWEINQTKENILAEYFRQNLSGRVNEFSAMFIEKEKGTSEDKASQKTVYSRIPKCPKICIDDRVLVQLSQVLCSSIFTKNYTYEPEGTKKQRSGPGAVSEKKLDISQSDYLHKSVELLPIFPIKKNHCFLFNFRKRSYEIQEFDQLEHLPDYPKTIVIPNGDIHIIGGTKHEKVVDSHLVFRSSSAEVFKLASLPVCRNPSNSLAYWGKCIFLVGGINPKHEWDSRCFKYALETKEWREIAPMNSPKPHQSCTVYAHDQNTPQIYCFGIPEHKRINIERYSILDDAWTELSITNFLSNPFNFAAGFVSIQINPYEILLFGGKRFLESSANNKRSTDRNLNSHVYCFQPATCSFLQKGELYPCLGVQYGQFYPIVSNNKVYSCEYLLCKTNPISRWYDNLQVVEVDEQGDIESVMVLEEE